MAIEEVGHLHCTVHKHMLTYIQEFSIEIPDKEADAIHSGTLLPTMDATTRIDK